MAIIKLWNSLPHDTVVAILQSQNHSGLYDKASTHVRFCFDPYVRRIAHPILWVAIPKTQGFFVSSFPHLSEKHMERKNTNGSSYPYRASLIHRSKEQILKLPLVLGRITLIHPCTSFIGHRYYQAFVFLSEPRSTAKAEKALVIS